VKNVGKSAVVYYYKIHEVLKHKKVEKHKIP